MPSKTFDIPIKFSPRSAPTRPRGEFISQGPAGYSIIMGQGINTIFGGKHSIDLPPQISPGNDEKGMGGAAR